MHYIGRYYVVTKSGIKIVRTDMFVKNCLKCGPTIFFQKTAPKKIAQYRRRKISTHLVSLNSKCLVELENLKFKHFVNKGYLKNESFVDDK
jgi:HJR/Mrr/RecB family endonuclease